MSKELIIIMILLVISLGTIWNYISLYKSVSNYWKIINPNMKKKDIKQVLNVLHDLDAVRDMYHELDEVLKMNNELEVRICDSLQMLIGAYDALKQDVTNIYKHTKYSTKKDAIEYIHNYQFNASIGVIDNILSMWPEYVAKSEGVKNDEQV